MKIAQHAQGGVTGAKVIQRNTDPHFLQMMQNAERQLFIDHKRRFGDLKLQQTDRVGGTHQDLADFSIKLRWRNCTGEILTETFLFKPFSSDSLHTCSSTQ